MKDKYIASIILHAVGDTVGYRNGEWEFKPGGYDKTLEKLYEFIDLGGVNHINLDGWVISDDTILHMKIAEALLTNFTTVNQLGKTLKEKFIEAYDQFVEEGLELRSPGRATMNNIKRMKDGGNWDDLEYKSSYGGAGASMRTACIGLAYHNPKDIGMLMQISIESSRITHNSAVGYLGGFATAYFISLSLQNVPIEKWPFMLLDILDSGKMETYIEKAGRDINEYINDGHEFSNKWKTYIDLKFDDNKNVIKKRGDKNLVARGKIYHKHFGYKYSGPGPMDNPSLNMKWHQYGFIGGGGDDSVIIAYDCLLDSGKNWEKLVIYSMLHIGDTDTTGCIAGSLYGALYGFEDVPDNFLKHLEQKDELTKIAEELYKKYGS